MRLTTIKGVINKIIKNLPKGHHIIFVTPYNGSKSGNEAQSLIQLRKYELEMAKKIRLCDGC